MYMEIQKLKKQGFRIRRIAKKLGISRTTVYKYLERSPEEMSLHPYFFRITKQPETYWIYK